VKAQYTFQVSAEPIYSNTEQNMIKDGSPVTTAGVSIFLRSRELFGGNASLVEASFVSVRLVCVSYIFPDEHSLPWWALDTLDSSLKAIPDMILWS